MYSCVPILIVLLSMWQDGLSSAMLLTSLVHKGVAIAGKFCYPFFKANSKTSFLITNHVPMASQRVLVLARIEGPNHAGVTMGNGRPECEITPSTDVKYPPGSSNSLQNQWLLIGTVNTFAHLSSYVQTL